jgi:hypothetical protein
MGQRILRAVRSGQDALGGAGSAAPQVTPWRLASDACAMPQNAATLDPGAHVTGWTVVATVALGRALRL